MPKEQTANKIDSTFLFNANCIVPYSMHDSNAYSLKFLLSRSLHYQHYQYDRSQRIILHFLVVRYYFLLVRCCYPCHSFLNSRTVSVSPFLFLCMSCYRGGIEGVIVRGTGNTFRVEVLRKISSLSSSHCSRGVSINGVGDYFEYYPSIMLLLLLLLWYPVVWYYRLLLLHSLQNSLLVCVRRVFFNSIIDYSSAISVLYISTTITKSGILLSDSTKRIDRLVELRRSVHSIPFYIFCFRDFSSRRRIK